MFQGKIRHIHFVGIGGSGMNGIAEVLITLGFIVTGSDMGVNANTKRLEKLGCQITIGHHIRNIDGAHVLVTSTAIPAHNIEVVEAKSRGVPVIPRAEMLAELMRMKYGLAIAGSHGKTTTTSMLAMCLVKGELDPTTVIGGKLDAFGSSAKLGHGDFLVAEADESDGSFLLLNPTIAVLTNIDPEHLDHWGSEENLIEGFRQFASSVPFFGCAVLCMDDDRVRNLIPHIERRIVTYGFHAEADVRAIHVRQRGLETSFIVAVRNESLGSITIHMPGQHNISNALAAIAVSLELNIPFEKIQAGLNHFSGVNRRFTIRSNGQLPQGGDVVTVIDDYAHHPVEIEAFLKSVRDLFPGKKITAIFQPHLYTRTRDFAEGFSSSLSLADEVILLDIYPARELPIEGVSSQMILNQISIENKFISSKEELINKIKQVKPEVLLTIGAGDIDKLVSPIKEAML